MNEKSTVLKSANVTLNSEAVTLEQKDLAPGTYYIKVVYNTNLSTDMYRLMISNPHECYGNWKTTVHATCTTYGEQQKHWLRAGAHGQPPG